MWSPLSVPSMTGSLLPPRIRSLLGRSLLLASWNSLNMPMPTLKAMAVQFVFPDRTSVTYCLASHDGMRVGAARRSSVA